MRSSSRADLLAIALAVAAAGLMSWERGRLAPELDHIKGGADAYLLPGVDQTYVASLGYRSALADLIYGHVLVSYGLHFDRKQLFVHVGDYLDVVNRLDPKFRAPYWFADTLLTMQPKAPPVAFYRKAREIQERGLKELPFDQELWSASGQFLAYLAPNQLTDPQEKEEYRRSGARHLMQACNLIGSNDAIPYHCVTAARLLNQEGNLTASRQLLERLQNVSDDPQIQELAASYLVQIAGQQAQLAASDRQQRFRARWHADLGLSPRVEANAVGPGFDPAVCAGRSRAEEPECSSSWRRWSTHDEAANQP